MKKIIVPRMPRPTVRQRLFAHQSLTKIATLALLAGLLSTPVLASAKEVIIDVRTPEEFQVGHPTGAINIPHSAIASGIASKGVSKQDTIKLYSRSGNRADVAKAALQSAGYTKVEIQQ